MELPGVQQVVDLPDEQNKKRIRVDFIGEDTDHEPDGADVSQQGHPGDQLCRAVARSGNGVYARDQRDRVVTPIP